MYMNNSVLTPFIGDYISPEDNLTKKYSWMIKTKKNSIFLFY